MSTHKVGKVAYTETYTSGSQATAIIVGLLIGVVLGVIIIAIVRVVRKEPMPTLPVSISNIGFKTKTESTA
ncbi:unnamed protein product [Rotaria sordida]|uniref:Uncharacterized protein n=1 Tax=Rotaria sordida TaxID=392033 RepID=A0A820L867_9BILA|nr:unnamed protein product [Rotaria sordida]